MTNTGQQINPNDLAKALDIADNALLIALLRHAAGTDAALYKKICGEAAAIASQNKDHASGIVYPESKLARVLLDQLCENQIQSTGAK